MAPMLTARAHPSPQCNASQSSQGSSVGLLTATRPARVKQGQSCPAPAKRASKRNHSSFTEAVVELMVTHDPFPSCILPTPEQLSCRIDQGILPLIDLTKLSPLGLLSTLHEVDRYVESTLSVDRSVPSPLAYSPDFDAFLERSLELAEREALGPAPFVVLLRILSHLRLGSDSKLAAVYTNYYTHFIVAFEDTMDRQPRSMTPAEYVTCFRAWARIDLPVLPIKGHDFGSFFKTLLSRCAFSVHECAQLLEAMAAIKGRHSSYRICSYQLADLSACLILQASSLPNDQLLSVARSAASFEWPTYQSLLPVLDAMCRQAIAREHGPNAASAAQVLDAAVASASAMRPRLGAELEARFPGWRREEAKAAVALA